jgi:C1A family cysteine protease
MELGKNDYDKENPHLMAPAVTDANWNWYTQGKVSTPYSQMSCGCCWAFATAATLESLAAIKGVDATIQ